MKRSWSRPWLSQHMGELVKLRTDIPVQAFLLVRDIHHDSTVLTLVSLSLGF